MADVDLLRTVSSQLRTKHLATAGTYTLKPYETYVVAVPQGTNITIVMPSPEEAFIGVAYFIWSNGNATGNVVVDFSGEAPGDVTLTADNDFLVCMSDGHRWQELSKVATAP